MATGWPNSIQGLKWCILKTNDGAHADTVPGNEWDNFQIKSTVKIGDWN